MTKCPHDRNEIVSYLLGDLSQKQSARIKKCLTECASCQQLVAEIQSTMTVLDRVTPPPSDFSGGDDFLHEIHHKIERQKALKPQFWGARRVLVGMTMILIIAAVVLNMTPKTSDVPTVHPGAAPQFVKMEASQSLMRTPTIRLQTSVKPVSVISAPSRATTMTRPKFPRKPSINLNIKTISGIQKS